MKQLAPVLLATGIALFSTGCSTNLAFLAERSRVEAQALQTDSRQAGLAGPEVSAADSLVASANLHWKEGDPLPAQQKSERAAALYRLAMAKSEAESARLAVDSTKAARIKEEERLNTYQEFLNEARALRKP